VSYLCRQTIGATAKNIFKRQKTVFTKKSESTVSTAVRRRTAGGSLSKLATVAAMLLVTATMAEIVIVTATTAEIVIVTMTIVIAIATMTEIVATGTMVLMITTAVTDVAIQSDFV